MNMLEEGFVQKKCTHSIAPEITSTLIRYKTMPSPVRILQEKENVSHCNIYLQKNIPNTRYRAEEIKVSLE